MSNQARLVEVLTQQFGSVKTTGNGWVRIPCPTCAERDRKKCKRYISSTARTSNCFICGVRVEVQELLGGRYMPVFGSEGPKVKVEKKIDPRAFEMPCYKFLQVNQLEQDHPAIKFLNKDHLFDMDSYWSNYNIFYIPVDGGKVYRSSPPYTTSAERLVFPVFEGDAMIGWQMRSIPGTFYGDRKDVVRYYHLFDKGSHVYNYDIAKQYDEVVVVEGVKKALKFPNAVATWGSGISDKQLAIIQQWPRVVMMLDAEDHNGTQQRAKEFVAGMVASGKDAINIDLRKYDAISPDDLPANTLQNIVKEERDEQRRL